MITGTRWRGRQPPVSSEARKVSGDSDVIDDAGHLGYGVADAIFLVRCRRSKWALNNDLFVDYLTTGLDAARLLTGLTAPD
jgi:hypothetical protein